MAAMQPFQEFLVRWAQADAKANAYAVFYAGSDEPVHVFMVEQMRAVAERWQKGLLLEARHMQQRMPRV